ncbi:MAG: beta-ketoacyl synthase [Bacteroidetes bacterium]|nr:beta-ketoacyl synthase [Bacteroidota bacterium]MBL6943271.1 beta-ketoacyl synthase [Bacteroidales bacterium]
MVYFRSDNIISSLGFGTEENFFSMVSGEVGIKTIVDQKYYPKAFPASMIDEERLNKEFQIIADQYSNNNSYTKLEKMIIVSVNDALSLTDIEIHSSRTAIILSTTKGNINLVSNENEETFEPERILLWKLGDIIQDFFGNPNKVIVVSNACISGALAINIAAMYIESEQFDNVIVTGGDLVTRFVVSGFMSFMSLSPTACKPFDKNRDGLSLGEAAGTVILSKHKNMHRQNIIFKGGATANDANHISGPSRKGDGSYIAIKKAIFQSNIKPEQIDHISSHGTATPYNDEMESISIDRHHLESVPVNSIKGYLGHTLGAAGIIETVILLEEMRQNILLKTAGFEELGISHPINIINHTFNMEINTCLKMASGFGGSNAALIISKV